MDGLAKSPVLRVRHLWVRLPGHLLAYLPWLWDHFPLSRLCRMHGDQ